MRPAVVDYLEIGLFREAVPVAYQNPAARDLKHDAVGRVAKLMGERAILRVSSAKETESV